MCLIHLIARNEGELFCGGRHHQYFQWFAKIFADLQACGATLVFFSDLTVQRWKIDEWLQRRTDEYPETLALFDQISRGLTVDEILKTRDNPRALMTAYSALLTEAKNYGNVYESTQHECDLELSRYARDNDAIAVLTEDTDFMIFEGNWQYWSVGDLNLDTLDTVALNRKALCDYLSLSHQQLALWSTLVGNDHTKAYFRDLSDFHRWLGPPKDKFRSVARYVQDFERLPFNLTDADIIRISTNVFRRESCAESRQMIKDSIQSYCLDYTDPEVTDPLLKESVKYSDIFSLLVTPIQTLTLTMYDLRRPDINKTYTEIMAALMRKQIGVLWKPKNDSSLAIELLAKWSHTEEWYIEEVYPIYPPDSCKTHSFTSQHRKYFSIFSLFSSTVNLPPLLTLLFTADNDPDSDLNATRWKLLLWIHGMQPTQLNIVKGLPMEYRLIAVTLLFMVQQLQITAFEADTILVAEQKVMADEINDVNVPDRLNSRYVHVAHLYGKISHYIRKSFSVAGLRPFINVSFLFYSAFPFIGRIIYLLF